MAMRYGYFDSEITGVDENGMPIFDRAETSELFALLFAKLVSNGVLASPADCFQVIAGSGMNVSVRPGFGIINGRFGYNNAAQLLSIDPASATYSRIDLVVLRCNYLDRVVEVVVKTGTAAANPVAPTLLQPAAGDYYELQLAQIIIPKNTTQISQSMIKDTRYNSSVCGIVTQLIDHLDTSTFYAQFDALTAEYSTKATAAYETFTAQAEEYLEEFSDALEDFNTTGRAQLNAVLAAMTAYLEEQKNMWDEWFAEIQDELDGDVAGNLQLQINDHETRITKIEDEIEEDCFTSALKDNSNEDILDYTSSSIIATRVFALA